MVTVCVFALWAVQGVFSIAAIVFSQGPSFTVVDLVLADLDRNGRLDVVVLTNAGIVLVSLV